MTAAPDNPEGGESQEAVSPAMRTLAVVLLVLPILGIGAHLALYLAAPDRIRPYVLSWGLRAVAFASFANLLGSFFHYRKTGMRAVYAARLLTYLWILSIALLLRVVWYG
jgi:hypothetical protein